MQQRTNYARGQRPTSPRDLTAKLAAAGRQAKQAREDAANVDVEQIRSDATTKAIDYTWPRAFQAGYDAAVEDFRNAGIDTDAVLALDDEDE